MDAPFPVVGTEMTAVNAGVVGSPDDMTALRTDIRASAALPSSESMGRLFFSGDAEGLKTQQRICVHVDGWDITANKILSWWLLAYLSNTP